MEDNIQNQEQQAIDSQQNADPHQVFMSIYEAQKITFQDVKEHLTGPVISIIAHVVVLTICATLVTMDAPPERNEIEVSIQEVDIKEIEKIPEPPQPEEFQEVADQTVEIDRPSVAATDVNVAVEETVSSSVAGPVGLGPTSDIVVPGVLSIKPSNSCLILPGVMAARGGGGGGKRAAAIRSGGGSSKTELGVEKGLRWLRDHQNADGSWGEAADRRPAFTALALLAFLAHGETPSSTEFGPCVLKGIKKVAEYVEKASPYISGDNNLYCHPIVTYAISEAYTMTKIPMLEPLVNKATEVIVKGQNQVGGFNYKFNNAAPERSDLSFGGWCMQALKAAFSAGSTTPGLEAAIEKSVKWTSGPQHCPGQGFAYQIGGAKNITAVANGSGSQMTAVGTLCLQLLGAGKLPAVKEGIAWLEKEVNVCNWKEPNGWDLYRWYYQTQAYFQFYEGKEKQWKDWNRMFTTELLKNQKPDGHWNTPYLDLIAGGGKLSANAGGEDKFSGLDGPVYGTSLCCLMLEVYYRYLPTFKVAETKAGAPAAAAEPAAAGGGEKKKDDSGLVIE